MIFKDILILFLSLFAHCIDDVIPIYLDAAILRALRLYSVPSSMTMRHFPDPVYVTLAAPGRRGDDPTEDEGDGVDSRPGPDPVPTHLQVQAPSFPSGPWGP